MIIQLPKRAESEKLNRIEKFSWIPITSGPSMKYQQIECYREGAEPTP